MKLVDRLLDHAQALQWAQLPTAAVDAAHTFITDSVGVALAGSQHPRLPQVRAAAAAWGQGKDARDWASGQRWPAASAALLNAYQMHNQEFDCVHEAAVVHPMASVLPALVAVAERQLRRGHHVSGAALLEAVVLAVDVAATLGMAHSAPMRFFRPAMCGALGASLGAARLLGFSRLQMADTLGIAYSQLAGTMQAHSEGSPMLALQVGLASRAAVMAVDLAAAGFSGPHDVIEGRFGYFNLFDAPLAPRLDAVQAVFAHLQPGSRIAELSHKPFPTGRAAHGALDGLLSLQAEHGFQAEQVRRIELAAPPLILRLVGRPALPAMDVNTARLCLGYLCATLLQRGSVGLQDFSPQALADPQRLAWAAHVFTVPNDVEDANALAPQTLRVWLQAAAPLTIELPAVLGHPQRPLSAALQRQKFDACCDFAGLPPPATEALHRQCRQLASLDEPGGLSAWLDLMPVPTPNPAHA